MNCQHFFYEIIIADEINHKRSRNLLNRLHGFLIILAYFSCPVNAFCGFRACHSQLFTGATGVLDKLATSNRALQAHSGSKQVFTLCYGIESQPQNYDW